MEPPPPELSSPPSSRRSPARSAPRRSPAKPPQLAALFSRGRPPFHAFAAPSCSPARSSARRCVLIDKLDKMPAEEVRAMLEAEAGVPAAAVDTLLSTLELTDLAALEAVMGADSPALRELRELFSLAEAYGLSEWLVLDLSVVRGLAYYTGVVFEGFDRSGELRAIFGGGRYDRLLGTFGGEELPAAGFGFGDAVIFEMLQSKGLLPTLPASTVQVVVFAMNADLRPQAMSIASSLRDAGVRVDMVRPLRWRRNRARRPSRLRPRRRRDTAG